MSTFKTALIGLSVSLVLCSINVRRAGWLDRVVQYQKKRFIDDFMKHHVRITARIEKAPLGYVDSKDWDYDSVIRLLTLIRDSEGAAPVRRAFRRTMKTNRRFLSFPESFKAFPSLMKDHVNDFHYDVDSREYYADETAPPGTLGVLDPNDVIVVANPVEAKLPSARISVALLKNILESRALVGRIMPTTELNISWPVTPKRIATTKPHTKPTDGAVESTPESTSEASEVPSTPPQADTSAVSGNGNGNETAVTTASTNPTETS